MRCFQPFLMVLLHPTGPRAEPEERNVETLRRRGATLPLQRGGYCTAGMPNLCPGSAGETLTLAYNDRGANWSLAPKHGRC
jgi:hypothetical protein